MRTSVGVVLILCLWLTGVVPTHADGGGAGTAEALPAAQPADPQAILDRLFQVRGLALRRDVPVRRVERRGTGSGAIQAGARRETPDAAARAQALLQMLGLLPRDRNITDSAVEVVQEQVADAYNITDNTLEIAPAANDQWELDEMRLVRQYMHALQSQNFGLVGKFRRVVGDREAALGLESLEEGDAFFTSEAYLAAAATPEEYERLSGQMDNSRMRHLNWASGILAAMLMFPTTQGEQFVAALYESGGWDAVNAAYERPPSSTEQVLHPDRYLAGDEPKLVRMPDITATMNGWSLEDSGVLGELTFLYYLSAGIGPGAAARTAEGWGGDSYLLLRNDATGQRALAVLSVWDTEADAREFAEAAEHMMSWRSGARQTVHVLDKSRFVWRNRATYIARSGQDALLVIGSDDVAVTSVVRRIPGFRP